MKTRFPAGVVAGFLPLFLCIYGVMEEAGAAYGNGTDRTILPPLALTAGLLGVPVSAVYAWLRRGPQRELAQGIGTSLMFSLIILLAIFAYPLMDFMRAHVSGN